MNTPLQVLVSLRSGSSPVSARTKFRLACPRFSDPRSLAEAATGDAVALVGAVRDEDPRVVFGALQYYTHDQMSVLCVALAAMVPTDRSAADLLGWLDPIASEVA